MTEEEIQKRDKVLREMLGSEEATRLINFAQQVFQRQQFYNHQDPHNNNNNNKGIDKNNEENLKDNEDIKTSKQLTRVPKELRLILHPTISKEERTRIHQLIKTYFPYLQSETKSQKFTDSSTTTIILLYFIHNLHWL